MEAPKFSDSEQVLLAKIAMLTQTGGGVTQAAVLAALGYTPANRAGDTFSGAVNVGAGVQLNTNGTAQFNGIVNVGTNMIRLNPNGTLNAENIEALGGVLTIPSYTIFASNVVQISDLGSVQFGSGALVIDLAGQFSWASTTIGGLRLNSLTTVQRDALTAATGDLIWNSTTSAVNLYNGSAWISLSDSNTVVNYAASTDLNFLGTSFRTITLGGNITFTTSNRAAVRSITVRIIGDGSTRTFTFPAGWKFVGGAAPASLAANKEAILTITAFGANDSDVRAAYAAEP